MAVSPKKSLALDTNLLLDLAEEKDFAHEFREEFRSRSYLLLIPPTVVAELDFLASFGSRPQSKYAKVALENLTSWACQPLALSGTNLSVAQRFAMRLIDLGLIPETEPNDGKILAQTSLAEIPLLVTSDKHLLDLDNEKLLLTFNDADLSPVH